MLKIRLKQIGKKHQKIYRVVVVDSKKKRDGEVLEKVGSYNPIPENSLINLEMEKIDGWINNGAQMTERVEKLYNLVKENKVK